jgi:hypothetical protein
MSRSNSKINWRIVQDIASEDAFLNIVIIGIILLLLTIGAIATYQKTSRIYTIRIDSKVHYCNQYELTRSQLRLSDCY